MLQSKNLPSRIDLMGVPVDPWTMRQTVERAKEIVDSLSFGHLIGVNADKLLQMRDDPWMEACVRRCEIVNADGASMVMAARKLKKPVPERVAGIDLMQELCVLAELESYRVYLLGAKRDVVERTREVLLEKHPNLVIVGAHDGYFGEGDFDTVAEEVRTSGAQIVFVGITSPKKEHLIERFRELGLLGIYVGVGGELRRRVGVYTSCSEMDAASPYGVAVSLDAGAKKACEEVCGGQRPLLGVAAQGGEADEDGDVSMRGKVMLVFGTRPEAIKMCPLVLELKGRSDEFETVVCVTGQHREMLDQVLVVFGVVPDYDLAIMRSGQTLFDITSGVLLKIKAVLEEERPDAVLVHGDTTTSFAAALAAFYLQIPVGHVEAGLRTRNLYSPWPEEFNRQAVDVISRWYFAPTETSRQNLLDEAKSDGRIFVTGNTGIDALRHTVREDYSHPELDWTEDSRLILITAHRRENLGEPMHRMFRAIRRVMEEHPDTKAIYPIHMNPQVRRAAHEELDGFDRLRIIDPLEVVDFHNFMARSHIILTDSGGIQEEAPSLGKPVLVMRDTTERPEGVAAGTLRLVGTEEESIYREFSWLLDDPAEYESMSQASNPYGDGHASERIASILAGA